MIESRNNRTNNFDFLRFIAASMVIIAHSVPLTSSGIDPFSYMMRGQAHSGELGVGIFFIISGYLICASWLKSSSALRYFYARFLRIFPALLMVLLISAFIVGPIFTTLSLSDYFHNDGTLGYLKSILLYPMNYSLPGVVFSSGKYGTAINGSLWTLSFEFNCYLMVALLGIFKLLKKELILLLLITGLFVILFQPAILPHADIENFFPYINQHQFIILTVDFISGMLFYLYKEQIIYNFKYLFICCFLFVLSAYFSVGYHLVFPLFGSYIVFYLAFSPSIQLHWFSKYGDFSYGIYIYGFLIQQCIIKLFDGDMSAILNWIISLPIAIVCGVLSWHLIEKHFLALKDKPLMNISLKRKLPWLNAP